MELTAHTSILSGVRSGKTFHAITRQLDAKPAGAWAGLAPRGEEIDCREASCCHCFPAASRDEWEVPRVMSEVASLGLPASRFWRDHPPCERSGASTQRIHDATRDFSQAPARHEATSESRLDCDAQRSAAQGRQMNPRLLRRRHRDRGSFGASSARRL